MPNQEKIAQLYSVWMDKSATSEEVQELFRILDETDIDPQNGIDTLLPGLMKQQWEAEDGRFIYEYTRQEATLKTILTRYPRTEPDNLHFLSLMRRWWTAAAVILLTAGLGTYFWISSMKELDQVALVPVSDIKSGSEGAILSLGDGSQVLLDTVKDGIVALQGGSIAKVVNGALLYEGDGKQLLHNTISTPRGRQYNLTLPDGTRVWLNAASSLRYPTIFSGNERRVEVTGEAFFEVTKSVTKPFKIAINGRVEVEVLGTSFNINAYDNESAINTTLVEGAVAVSNEVHINGKAGTNKVILTSGQQARVVIPDASNGQEAGISVIEKIDIGKITAWKEGVFNFNGMELEDVMRQLERWYDIHVVYENGIPNIRFGGKMSRNINLDELLKVLQASEVRFRMEPGRRLVVLP